MKKSHTVSLLLTTLLLSIAGVIHAQAPGLSREMVKMDRNTFYSLYNWDDNSSNWVLKSGMMPPQGVKTREEIVMMRNDFLSMNVWNDNLSEFLPIKGGRPRDMSTLSRDQVKMETSMFFMNYRFDPTGSQWIKISR